MIAGRNSEDYYPLTWVGRFPVYLATVIVALHVAGMLATVLCMATGAGWVLGVLSFSPEGAWAGRLWQPVTYAFVNKPDLWFVIEMWLLYSFGREVEQFLGRKTFCWMYAALILAAPVAVTVASLAGMPSGLLQGASAAHFAVFVAFVLIYPNAEFFFGLRAKWLAIILLAINSLQSLAANDWTSLGVLWVECGCVYLMLVARGVRRLPMPEAWLTRARRRRGRRPLRPLAPAELREDEADPIGSIDPLLEKISKYGIGSLTRRERERLENAREALLEREKDD